MAQQTAPQGSASRPIWERWEACAREQVQRCIPAISWKLLQVAEKTCRRLHAPAVLPAVYAGAT